MNIDYNSKRTTSITADFTGETEDGRSFTITANWNDWDDWTADEVTWDDAEGTDEEVEEIKQKFQEDMN